MCEKYADKRECIWIAESKVKTYKILFFLLIFQKVYDIILFVKIFFDKP